MRITLHRPNQIGGCITELVSSKGTRIFVDLGHNLPKGDQESIDFAERTLYMRGASGVPTVMKR